MTPAPKTITEQLAAAGLSVVSTARLRALEDIARRAADLRCTAGCQCEASRLGEDARALGTEKRT